MERTTLSQINNHGNHGNRRKENAMQTATKRTGRHGVWQRTTRVWLVGMLLGILALAMQVGTVGANPQITTIDPNVVISLCGTVQCISGVQVTPHGQFAKITFTTSVARVATVQVSTVAPKKLPDGTWSYQNLPVDSFQISPSGTQHTVEMPNLQLGTAYHFLINAGKANTGGDAQYHGTFTTLKRYVKATVTEIDVIDDSDALSAGDLVFNLRVNGAGPAIFPGAETTQWSSGEAKTVNLQVTAASDDQATVTLEGWDWDDSQQGWLIGQAIVLDGPATSGIDGDRADASKNFNVAGNGHDQAFSQNFSIQTTNQSLKWTAFGSIQVFYAP